MVAGTVALVVSLLIKVTTRPPAGAGSDRVSGTERVKPGATNAPVGRFKDVARTVNAALPVTNSLAVAVMVALPTATVDNVKVAELAPAGRVIDAGTVATPVLLLFKVTFRPELPAGTLDCTVTAVVRPIPKVNWFAVNVKAGGGVTVTWAWALTNPALLTVTVVFPTSVAVKVKVAVVCPVGMVIVVGTLPTAGTLETRFSTMPSVPAG